MIGGKRSHYKYLQSKKFFLGHKERMNQQGHYTIKLMFLNQHYKKRFIIKTISTNSISSKNVFKAGKLSNKIDTWCSITYDKN